MFVPKDFVLDCFVAQICANYDAHAHFGANLRDEAIPKKILKGGGQTFFRAFINSELGPPLVALTQN